jgi:hypothetical protein
MAVSGVSQLPMTSYQTTPKHTVAKKEDATTPKPAAKPNGADAKNKTITGTLGDNMDLSI